MKRTEFIQQFVKDAPWTPDVEESLYASGRVEWAIHQADALEAAGIVFDPETPAPQCAHEFVIPFGNGVGARCKMCHTVYLQQVAP